MLLKEHFYVDWFLACYSMNALHMSSPLEVENNELFIRYFSAYPHTLVLWIYRPLSWAWRMWWTGAHLISLLWCDVVRFGFVGCVKVAGRTEGHSLPEHCRWFITLCSVPWKLYSRSRELGAELNTSHWCSLMWALSQWWQRSHTALWVVTHAV